MKNRKTRISGDDTSTRQSSHPVIGPTCQAAVISWPDAARTASAAAKVSQNATAITVRCSRERIARPPPTMSTSASASHTDIGPHQNGSGSARSGPNARKQRTRPMFDGLKTCRPAKRDHVLREQADGARAGEEPPPVQAPPVAVLRPGHAQDECDPVAGEQRARRPHDHPLPPEGDRDLEERAREQRDEDLGDREREVERRLPEYLQRDDHRGEMEARVAQRGQEDGVRAPADAERRRGRRPVQPERSRRPELVEGRGIGWQREHFDDERVLEFEEQHLIDVQLSAPALPGCTIESGGAFPTRQHVDQP